MRLEIPYAKKSIQIDIPDKNILNVFECCPAIHTVNEEEIIKGALARPINSENLARAAEGKTSAAILTSDITRPCPSYEFLPHIVDELEGAGVKEIKIIFGLGIHRLHTDREKENLVGDYVAGKAKLIDSDIKSCLRLGVTSRGTPVEVFREAIDADMLIATGNLEYHYFAGYSGGAKALMPGVCSKATISANHSMMLDKSAAAGNYDSNPVALDIKESTAMVPIDFLFNVILDDNKNITAAVAGNVLKAHREGIKIYDERYFITAQRKADIVITSPGGSPKDINLYQAQKALDNVKEIVKPGGSVLLIASCMEGCGEDTFEKWMEEANDYPKLREKIKKEFMLGAHKAVVISRMINDFKVYLYSEFSKQKTEAMGLGKLENLQKFINIFLQKDCDIKVTVVTSGRFVKFRGQD